MKKINIGIDNAKILNYSVELNTEIPEVSATIGLFSGDKKISSFSLRTQTYYSESIQFRLPIDMIEPIKQIAEQLNNLTI